MMDKMRRWANWLVITGLMLSAFLSACSHSTSTSQTPEEASMSVDATGSSETTIAASNTETPVPTATPLPGKAVLITSGMDENLKSGLSTSLTDLAVQSSLTYEERTDFQADQIGAECKVVVLYTSDTAIIDATAAIPATQFIIYTEQELTPAANQSIIHLRRDKQAFIAGYMSLVITSDWRAAGLFPSGTVGDMEEQAFMNGGGYFCGICNPYYAPLVRFPVSARISSADDASVWQGELDTLLADIIYTVYVAPGSESQVLWDTLAQNGLVLIGSGDPPAGLEGQWAASIKMDTITPLTEIWPDVVNGTGGKSVDTSVSLANINESYLTPGKQLLVEKTISELNDSLYPLDVAE